MNNKQRTSVQRLTDIANLHYQQPKPNTPCISKAWYNWSCGKLFVTVVGGNDLGDRRDYPLSDIASAINYLQTLTVYRIQQCPWPILDEDEVWETDDRGYATGGITVSHNEENR